MRDGQQPELKPSVFCSPRSPNKPRDCTGKCRQFNESRPLESCKSGAPRKLLRLVSRRNVESMTNRLSAIAQLPFTTGACRYLLLLASVPNIMDNHFRCPKETRPLLWRRTMDEQTALLENPERFEDHTNYTSGRFVRCVLLWSLFSSSSKISSPSRGGSLPARFKIFRAFFTFA